MDVRVNYAGFISLPLDWSLTFERTRAWTDLDLWYLVEGRGQVENAQGIFPLLPGACLIMKGGEDYTFTVDRSLACRHYYVHFDYIAGDGKAIPPLSAPAPDFYRSIEAQHFVELILQRLVSAKGTKKTSAASDKWLATILEEIKTQDEQDKSRQNIKNDSLLAEFESLCKDIRQHPENQWPVEEMAEKVMMSRSHFYRLFKESYNRSPQQFVLEERMRLARSLLRDSSNTINWIAQFLGYCDVYFFTRQFKKFNGISPGQFRTVDCAPKK